MATALQIAAIFWMAGGVFASATANSVLHEILGLLAGSFGLVFLALAAILSHMREQGRVEGHILIGREDA
jgi:preprotein translocase subunit SecG